MVTIGGLEIASSSFWSSISSIKSSITDASFSSFISILNSSATITIVSMSKRWLIVTIKPKFIHFIITSWTGISIDWDSSSTVENSTILIIFFSSPSITSISSFFDFFFLVTFLANWDTEVLTLLWLACFFFVTLSLSTIDEISIFFSFLIGVWKILLECNFLALSSGAINFSSIIFLSSIFTTGAFSSFLSSVLCLLNSTLSSITSSFSSFTSSTFGALTEGSSFTLSISWLWCTTCNLACSFRSLSTWFFSW